MANGMKRRRRGSSLIMAMSVMMLLSILGIGVLTMSLSAMRSASHRQSSRNAFDLAEAGVVVARQQLAEDAGYAGIGSTLFGEGEFSVTVTQPPGNFSRRVITSTGSMPSLDGSTVQRQVTEVLSVGSIHELFQYAAVSNEDLKLHREFRITSAPAAGQVRIHANDDIKAKDTIFVDGVGFAVDEIDLEDSPSFTGGTQTGVAPLAFPIVDPGLVDTLASSISVQSGDMLVNSGETVVLMGKYDGKVEVMDGGHVIVDGLVFITGEFKMNSGARISGAGTIVGLKKIKLYGDSSNTLGDSNRLAFVSMESNSHAIELNGPDPIKGLLYAPNTHHLHFKDTPLIGAVAAKSIYLHGSGEIIHDQLILLNPPPELDLIMPSDGASDIKRLYWRHD